MPRLKGRRREPSLVVPSGKLSTQAPASRTRKARRSVMIRLMGSSRLTNSTPIDAIALPISGHFATSPLLIAMHGAAPAMSTGSM